MDSDASASDVMRVKIAFPEVVRRQAAEQEYSPHPGLLVLDDPRQHDMNEDDFSSIVRTLALQGSGQTIVTTSSASELVQEAVGDSSATVVDYGEVRLLRTLDDVDPMDVT